MTGTTTSTIRHGPGPESQIATAPTSPLVCVLSVGTVKIHVHVRPSYCCPPVHCRPLVLPRNRSSTSPLRRGSPLRLVSECTTPPPSSTGPPKSGPGFSPGFFRDPAPTTTRASDRSFPSASRSHSHPSPSRLVVPRLAPKVGPTLQRPPKIRPTTPSSDIYLPAPPSLYRIPNETTFFLVLLFSLEPHFVL